MNISDVSNEQLAGQRLMVGFDGTDLTDDLRYFIDTLMVGGIILFSPNLVNPPQIRRLCLSIQQYADFCGQPPLFIAIDQEGGQVARLKAPFTQFPGNPSIRNHDDAERFADVTSRELHSVGINMNMAPVMDVPPEGFKSVMAGRVFCSDPEQVSALGATVIRGMQNNRVMAVAKHFPGIGRTTLDSHVDLPYLDTDLPTLETSDLVPFQAAIKLGVAGIMMSHICYTAIDPGLPAGLSAEVTDRLLRKRMGFQGIILTDDLDMGAIQKHYDIRTSINHALGAGIDIALICHQGPDIQTAFDEIMSRIETSRAIRDSARTSMQRIMKAKQTYCRLLA